MDKRMMAAPLWPESATFDERSMQAAFELEGDEFLIPVRFEVCGTCEGRGTYVKPSVDAHGLTDEELVNDWDFREREAYFQGAYDELCAECGGRRVVFVVDDSVPSTLGTQALEHWRGRELKAREERAREIKYGF